MTANTSEAFFEDKYRANADPWNFATNQFELDRYKAILEILQGRHFVKAFEPGCSVGVLTRLLSETCSVVEACDISETAVSAARIRCQGLENIHIHHASMKEFMPASFDLYAFCEIGYYMAREELAAVLAHHLQGLVVGGTVVACHWLGQSSDHVLSGDDVHEVLHSVPALALRKSKRYPEFRLDCWRKRKASHGKPD